jgi:hypothetical protein
MRAAGPAREPGPASGGDGVGGAEGGGGREGNGSRRADVAMQWRSLDTDWRGGQGASPRHAVLRPTVGDRRSISGRRLPLDRLPLDSFPQRPASLSVRVCVSYSYLCLPAFLSLSRTRALSLSRARLPVCQPAWRLPAVCAGRRNTRTHLLAPVLARSSPDDSESEDQRESPQLHAHGAVRGSGGGFGLPSLSKVGAVGVLAVGDIGGAVRSAVVGGHANARKAPSPHQLRDRCLCLCLRVGECVCARARSRLHLSLALSRAHALSHPLPLCVCWGGGGWVGVGVCVCVFM